jgi:hypothetical protein
MERAAAEIGKPDRSAEIICVRVERDFEEANIIAGEEFVATLAAKEALPTRRMLAHVVDKRVLLFRSKAEENDFWLAVVQKQSD